MKSLKRDVATLPLLCERGKRSCEKWYMKEGGGGGGGGWASERSLPG